MACCRTPGVCSSQGATLQKGKENSLAAHKSSLARQSSGGSGSAGAEVPAKRKVASSR